MSQENQKLTGDWLTWMISGVLIWCWFRPSGLIFRELFSYQFTVCDWWIGMRRMLCLCNTYLKYTRVIRKDRVYPILNNWYDDKSKMKTMVEDRKSSRRLGDNWWSWLGCTPKKMETVGDRPDVLGDRWICEVLGASGFVQTQNGLANGWYVWYSITLYCIRWSLLNIYLFGGGEFILLLNALLWDVRA